jgi:hypothetical protein
MKKILLINILLILLLAAKAQEYHYVPFPDSGAVWSEMYYPRGDVAYNPARQVFDRFTLTGEDTVINNQTYKKLYHYYDSIFTKSKATCIGGIREDSLKRVYYRGDTAHYCKPHNILHELILYDFSLNIGDKILYEFNYNVNSNLAVSNIDTVLINNTLRKRFSFNNNKTEWIEGIGSNDGLLFTSTPTLTGAYYPEGALICFLQNNELLYHNEAYNSCYLGTNSIEQLKIQTPVVELFGMGEGVIQLTCKSPGELRLYGIDGRLIQKNKLLPTTQLVCSPETGILLFRFTTTNGEVQTGKVMVQ